MSQVLIYIKTGSIAGSRHDQRHSGHFSRSFYDAQWRFILPLPYDLPADWRYNRGFAGLNEMLWSCEHSHPLRGSLGRLVGASLGRYRFEKRYGNWGRRGAPSGAAAGYRKFPQKGKRM